MLVGIAKAKADGKYKGRAPTARAKAEKVKQLRAAGVPSEIARQLSISRTSAHRILDRRAKKGGDGRGLSQSAPSSLPHQALCHAANGGSRMIRADSAPPQTPDLARM
jgi:hypothetical protein